MTTDPLLIDAIAEAKKNPAPVVEFPEAWIPGSFSETVTVEGRSYLCESMPTRGIRVSKLS